MATQTELSAFDRSELMTDGGEPRGFDPEAETVTEGWEGAFLACSWGYGQTQTNFAQIVEVSDSGKTVVARRVNAEVAQTVKGSEQVRPTGEQFGDEFRLHVRNSGGDPAFRGSYPFTNEGKKDDGTRRDSFLPQNPEETAHQTAPGYGH